MFGACSGFAGSVLSGQPGTELGSASGYGGSHPTGALVLRNAALFIAFVPCMPARPPIGGRQQARCFKAWRAPFIPILSFVFLSNTAASIDAAASKAIPAGVQIALRHRLPAA